VPKKDTCDCVTILSGSFSGTVLLQWIISIEICGGSIKKGIQRKS
jgi:hypothetical protein